MWSHLSVPILAAKKNQKNPGPTVSLMTLAYSIIDPYPVSSWSGQVKLCVWVIRLTIG